ncbi:YggS family pyridoxal phosphate-dependent enzyme [Qingshengfaniella alkalisoli]|uniref:Pyridoxal phosphate homeostasis protein n=1 Tax=Qingshengfaniella alkalisoli TaxID=2599296 RepID=A0A5B8I533_9RHOB|nr:YggS family pyridoxal phosphate-dependent enzyme [Qingshengfaniella alkalisoli]QDY68345.1 YggS family pyridoxal phosphate-dependent enzyme [Qingshengfaniella alkalisoli]
MSLTEIKQRIEAEEKRVGRAVGSTKLIAVSKVQPLDRVTHVLDQGHRMFGENRVQEAQGRWGSLLDRYDGIELHLLGPLQSNKVRPAAEMFDAIHSLDREKLARKLADLAQERGQCPELFVQVNTGEEPQKAGVLPEAVDAFIELCRSIDLPITGLMCIPPVDEEPSLHFALLRKLAERNGLTGLSMGMSGDFERAVALGATHVRVGSAIFGEREKTA